MVIGTTGNEDVSDTVCGIYAHGELEKVWGYDIVRIPKWNPFLHGVEEGIYDCWFVYPNSEIVDAKIFVWVCAVLNGKPLKKGLVVKVGDDKYMADAQKKYDAKAEFI